MPDDRPDDTPDHPAPLEPGLYLFITVTRDTVSVRQVARLEKTSRYHLRAPLLTPATRADFESPASELVLEVIGADGKVLDSFGWPAEAEAFVDRLDPETGDFVHTPPARSWEWDARFRIPLGANARYLRFYRADLRGTGERATITPTPLGLFDLRPDEPGGPPDFPVPWPGPPTSLPLPPVRRATRRAGGDNRDPFDGLNGPAPRSPRSARRDGRIVNGLTLRDTGSPETCFDVVILGDGFRSDELLLFDRSATLLAEGLIRIPPFSDFTDRINVHVVRVISTDSGITNCPDQHVRRTFFQTRGFFRGEDSPTFIGTTATQTVFDAIDTIIPQEYANLVFVIVNCQSERGGSAPLGLGMAFVTLIPDSELFINVAAHEAAHVIAELCEEYNSCQRRDQNRVYPNEASLSQVDAGRVWWKDLAQPSELRPDGRFTAIHRHGDPVDAKCQPIMVPAELSGMLGAFYGCHNGSERNDAAGTARYCHRCGRDVFRPMAECKMRRTSNRFCRVCAELISRAIVAIAPTPAPIHDPVS